MPTTTCALQSIVIYICVFIPLHTILRPLRWCQNCPDGTDESAEACIQTREHCHKPFHKCTYGGCVIGKAPCDGKEDCADGSDETLLRCGDEFAIEAFERKLRDNCYNDELKCPSGICIENHKRCDGQDDCGDGYDETVKLCGHIECPGYAFTCGYGACIHERLKCNGAKDCFDGSDEASLLCNTTRILPSISGGGGAGGGGGTVSTATPSSSQGCPLPAERERPLIKDRNGFPKSEPIQTGEVFFSCERGYTLVGERVNFCVNKKWSVNVAKCQSYAACQGHEFECDNGICIQSFDLCDGVKNCPDGSDESAEACIQTREHCHKPFHKCTYGGCAIGKAPCDGKDDCADGSDETLLRCGDEFAIEAFERKLRDNCYNDELKCPSGICIENHKRCDGQDDCGDGYDETVKLCGHIECPGYAFTCGYGACIHERLKCNGAKDCFDGSDEASLLCNTTRILPPISGGGGAGGGGGTVSTATPSSSQGCPLPAERERPLIKDRNGFPKSVPIQTGEVFFSCERGYTLVGERVNFCVNKKWSVDVAKCQKFCDTAEIIGGYSTVPTCHYMGEVVSCKQKLRPGAVVTFLCATYFRNYTELPTLRCLGGGIWSGSRRACESECGEIATPTKEFSAFGFEVENRVVPWHAGLYAIFDDVKYQFVCGGTVLTPDLVITAAHCIWDRAIDNSYDPSILQIGFAKAYRDYYKEESLAVFRNVSHIYPHEQYKGVSTNYVNDIAVIQLKGVLKFSNIIRPICVLYYINAEKEVITNSTDGSFAGWDFQGENMLQLVEAHSKSHESCVTEYQADLASDKFCLFSKAGAKACRGDSGGGFVYRRQNSNKPSERRKHNLLGIISNAPGADLCAADLVVLTNIQYFDAFIEKHRQLSIEKRS